MYIIFINALAPFIKPKLHRSNESGSDCCDVEEWTEPQREPSPAGSVNSNPVDEANKGDVFKHVSFFETAIHSLTTQHSANN